MDQFNCGSPSCAFHWRWCHRRFHEESGGLWKSFNSKLESFWQDLIFVWIADLKNTGLSRTNHQNTTALEWQNLLRFRKSEIFACIFMVTCEGVDVWSPVKCSLLTYSFNFYSIGQETWIQRQQKETFTHHRDQRWTVHRRWHQWSFHH